MNPEEKKVACLSDAPAPIETPGVCAEHVPVIIAAVAAALGERARVTTVRLSDERPNERSGWTRGEVPTLKHQQRPEPRKPKWTRSSGG